uniref:DUF1618 domain-containing protein n=1 Tax=Oryza brachyantha TaxID=4533 RepID=J3M596_ORYBR
MDSHAPAPVVSRIVSGDVPSGASELNGLDLNDPDFTRFVCNPVSGEVFRLPDIDGTKKTMFRGCQNTGLLTRSAAAHGPADSYAVAMLHADRSGGTFTMRRFLSQTVEWEKLTGLPSPLPIRRPMEIYPYTPRRDLPELHFVELPGGSGWPVASSTDTHVQGMHRRVGVSEGRLCYVEVSQKDPFVLSSFALDDDGVGWTPEHRVALGRLCTVNGRGPKDTPRIAVIDPLDASVIFVIVGEHLLAVDMDMEKVLRCSPADETDSVPYAITSVLKPCVLPPWLASAKIPATGTSSGNKGVDKSKALSDLLVRVDRGKKN